MTLFNWAAYHGSGNVFDDNLSTYVGVATYNGEFNVTYASTFSTTHNIIEVKHKYFMYLTAMVPTINTYTVSLYWSGSWHTIGSGAMAHDNLQTVTYTGDWNASAVKANYHLKGGIYDSAYARFYELTAIAEKYDDIGIRLYDGSSDVAIGTEAVDSSHKLRIRKGSTTYGIPLLSTSDDLASNIRIYDGSSVKALALATD